MGGIAAADLGITLALAPGFVIALVALETEFLIALAAELCVAGVLRVLDIVEVALVTLGIVAGGGGLVLLAVEMVGVVD